MIKSGAHGTVVSRRWLLGGTAVGVTHACVATAAGTLIYKAADSLVGASNALASSTGDALSAITTSAPLRKGQAATVQLLGVPQNAVITGTVPGMKLDSAARTLSGTPTGRSFLLRWTANGTGKDTLLFSLQGGTRTMKLGMGTAGLNYYSPNDCFIDYMKCAGINDTPATADANGMPITLKPDGNGRPGASYLVPLDDGRTTPVKYRVITDGDIDVEIWTTGGFNVNAMREAGDLVFTHNKVGWSGANCYLIVRAVRRPPTRLALVRDDQSALFRSGEIFKPGFLADMAGMRHIRFMNWSATNDPNPVSVARDYITYARAVPLEIQAELVRRTGIAGWFNLHAKVTDAEWKAAQALLDPLAAKGLVKVEYSNEVWNPMFAQCAYARERALALGFRGDTAFAAQQYWNGYRAAQLAASSRGKGYQWCIGCQPVQQRFATYTFDGIAAAGGSASDFKIWTTTVYLSGTLTVQLNSAQYALQKQWRDTANYDAALNNLANFLDPNAFSAEQLRLNLNEAKRVANSRGLRLEAYEANYHLNNIPYLPPEDIKSMRVFHEALVVQPKAKDVWTQALEVAEECGVDCVTQFDYNSIGSDSGNFGMRGKPSFAASAEWLANGGSTQATTMDGVAIVPPTRSSGVTGRYVRIVIAECGQNHRTWFPALRNVYFQAPNSTTDVLAVWTGDAQPRWPASNLNDNPASDNFWSANYGVGEIRGVLPASMAIGSMDLEINGDGTQIPGKVEVWVSETPFSDNGRGGVKVLDLNEPSPAPWTLNARRRFKFA